MMQMTFWYEGLGKCHVCCDHFCYWDRAFLYDASPVRDNRGGCQHKDDRYDAGLRIFPEGLPEGDP